MGKVKKAFLFIIGLMLATAAVCYGLMMYTEAQPSDELDYFDSKIDEDSVYKVYTKTKHIGNAYGDTISREFCEEYIIPADSKYIWLSGEKMMALSGAKLQSKIIESAERQGIPIYEDLNGFMCDLENCVYNFTAGYNQSFYKLKAAYWKYYDSAISAFDGVFPEFESLSDEYHNTNPLALKGLNLKVKNIEIEKVFASDSLISESLIAAQVGADVTCKKKSENFDCLEWLPEKGETRHITFVYYCWTDDQLGGRQSPYEIFVLSSEGI